MHKSVQMIVLFPTTIIQRGIIFVLLCSLTNITEEVEHPWSLYYHGDFLGILRYKFAIFQSTQRSQNLEQRGTITTLSLVTIDIDILGVVEKYTYMLLFYEPIQGSSRVIHSCMFICTVEALLGGSTFIIICSCA